MTDIESTIDTPSEIAKLKQQIIELTNENTILK